MVSKCANPNCFATFRYLHEGKLFVMEEHESGALRAASHPPRCFWLCAQCSRTLAVSFDVRGRTRLIPVPTATGPRSSCEVFPCGHMQYIDRP